MMREQYEPPDDLPELNLAEFVDALTLDERAEMFALLAGYFPSDSAEKIKAIIREEISRPRWMN